MPLQELSNIGIALKRISQQTYRPNQRKIHDYARKGSIVDVYKRQVLYICYAVASVFVVVAALQIYIKMNTGEDGVVKSIVSLVGACLFIIGASIVFPAFFGYRI